MDSTRALLRGISLFQELPEPALDEIAALSRPRAVEEGSFFFMQGDPASHMYVLTQGRAKLTQSSPEGQVVGMRMIGPAQMFAAIAILDPEKGYPVTAEAVEDSSALAWAGKELHALAGRYPALSFNIMAAMREHMEEMQSRYRELSTERVEQRVARALLRLTLQTGRKLENGIELTLSRQDLAEMSGTTLFTASRILSKWERQGLIEAGRQRVLIRQPHGLASIAEDLSK